MTGPENLYFMKFLRVIHRSSPIKVHHRRCPGGPIAKKRNGLYIGRRHVVMKLLYRLFLQIVSFTGESPLAL